MRIFLSVFLLCALSLPADAADKRFLAFGDSITVGHGDVIGCDLNDNTGLFGGYPTRLRSRLASRGIDAEFVNRGICGERTDSGLTRIDSVLAAGGDVVVIMEGTNDVSQFVGFESTLFNLNAMAGKAELLGIEPLLASIVPRGPDSGTDTHNGKTRTIRDELRADALENGWAFADPFEALFSRSNFFEFFYFNQLHPNSSGYTIISDSMLNAAEDAATRDDLCQQVPPGPCAPGATTLCLNQSRFRLDVLWKNFTGQTGLGNAVPQTDDTGAFYWIDPANIELIIKVLDGRADNGHFWVFYGALSSLEFTLVVTDTQTGECKEYFNTLGTFASVGDTLAFDG